MARPVTDDDITALRKELAVRDKAIADVLGQILGAVTAAAANSAQLLALATKPGGEAAAAIRGVEATLGTVVDLLRDLPPQIQGAVQAGVTEAMRDKTD